MKAAAEASCLDILEAIARITLMAKTCSLSHLRATQLSHFLHTVAACWQLNMSLVTSTVQGHQYCSGLGLSVARRCDIHVYNYDDSQVYGDILVHP